MVRILFLLSKAMAFKKNNIFIVGITGGIGTGKSTVCAVFERNGAKVFHADDIAKELSVRDLELRKQIVELLGREAYDAKGTLQRSYIAQKIFSDNVLRKQYEALLHPRVKRAIEEEIAILDPVSVPCVVVEAALLYEAGWNAFCDLVIVVEAPEDVCIERVAQRNGVAEDDVRARMMAQMPPAKKSRQGDIVLRNTGSREELENKVQFLFQLIHSMKGEKNRG